MKSMFGLQQELMWDSLCSMYHSHQQAQEGQELSALELKLVDALWMENQKKDLVLVLETLGKALKGAEVFLIWRNLEESGIVLCTTIEKEQHRRMPLIGPFVHTLKGCPSIIFDARMIPILKALPIVHSGSMRSMVTRAWKNGSFQFWGGGEFDVLGKSFLPVYPPIKLSHSKAPQWLRKSN